MSYLPPGMPLPEASPEDGPFWAACREHRLVLRHCIACDRFSHPPMPTCGHCGSEQVDWREVAGTGTVFSYTVAHHPVHKALKERGPYNVVVVALDGAGDTRLVSNLVDASPTDIRIGEPVELAWEEAANGQPVPRFRRRAVATQEAT